MCEQCSIETEIEWRTRLTLKNAQNVIEKWFRNRYCIVEEYRLQRKPKYIRRIGSRIDYPHYEYNTIDEYLNIHGLNVHADDEKDDQQKQSKRPTLYEQYFSNVKTTNCSHMLFYSKLPQRYEFDDKKDIDTWSTERLNQTTCTDNQWPQTFLFKRSLEIDDAFIEAKNLTTAEFIENEKSDNNLGVLMVRRISRHVKLKYNHDELNGRLTSREFRIAIYSFLDEYQQIRYELAIEFEFESAEENQKLYRDYWSRYEETVCSNLTISMNLAGVTINDAHNCMESQLVRRVDSQTIHDIVDIMSFLVRMITESSLQYDELPMIQVNIDWIPNDIGVPCGGKVSNNESSTSNVSSDTMTTNNGRDDERDCDDVLSTQEGVGRENNDNGTSIETSRHETVASVAGIEYEPLITADDSSIDLLFNETLSECDTRTETDCNETSHAKPVERQHLQSLTISNSSTVSLLPTMMKSKSLQTTSTKSILRNSLLAKTNKKSSVSLLKKQHSLTKYDDFLETTNTSLNTKLLSLSLTCQEAGTLDSFVNFVSTHLIPRWERGQILLRKKIDGTRMYATYDGEGKLYGDNGNVIDVSKITKSTFSTNFVYQLERYHNKKLKRINYMLTEIVAVRNVFVSQLNPLFQSFSSSVMPYHYSSEQQWPYGLLGTGLSDHDCRSILQFHGCSACTSTSNQRTTKKLIDQLRTPIIINDKDEETKKGQEEEKEEEEEEEEKEEDKETKMEKDDTLTKMPKKRAPCHECWYREKSINQNTHIPFNAVNGRSTNHEFINLTVDDSLSYLSRLVKPISMAKNSTLRVNELITPDNHSAVNKLLTDIRQFYRYSIISLADILFLSGKHNECKTMLQTHFSTIESSCYVQHYENKQSTLACKFVNEIPIDGYLVYVSSTEHHNRKKGQKQKELKKCRFEGTVDTETGQIQDECRTVEKSLCAYDYVLKKNENVWQNGATVKLKPYQTIELLLRIGYTNVDMSNSMETEKLTANLTFCTKATIVEQQNDLAAQTYLYTLFVPLDDQDIVPLCDFKWYRNDGSPCKVYTDPRIHLYDKRVYEFVCYTENIFFLIGTRYDKQLPDAENKVNSMVYQRKQLRPLLNTVFPLRKGAQV